MRTATITLSVLFSLSVGPAARAQTFDFEPPAYVLGPLGGHQGWATNALPPAFWTGQSVDAYSQHPYGIVTNPQGGAQFVTGRTLGNPLLLAGSNHPFEFGTQDVWTAEWDCLAMYDGVVLPASDNLGGFRTGIPGGNDDYWQANPRWTTHASTADAYDLTYWKFPASGGGGTPQSPGAAWMNIPVNHWIHQSTTWSYASNTILSVSIRDITAAGPTTTLDLRGEGWYLAGGADNRRTLPRPTGIMMYSGGGISNSEGGNIVAWDNIRVVPAFSCGSADFNCDGDIGTDADIEAFFACLGGNCPSAPCANSADFNFDGDIGTDADIESFFRVLGGGSC